MGEIRLSFKNLKAVSTNALYKSMGKSRKKTTQYKYMEQVVKFEMLKNREKIKAFLSGFDKKVDIIDITVYSELKDLVITKAKDKDRIGCISMTCLDVDNSFKGLIDSVFNNIDLNDAEICSIKGYKFQSDEKCNNIYIELKTLNREESWKTLKAYLKENTQTKH